MSFTKAKKNFEDNARYINPKADPVMFNVNAGLLQLTKAMADHIAVLESKIVHLSQQIAQIR